MAELICCPWCGLLVTKLEPTSTSDTRERYRCWECESRFEILPPVDAGGFERVVLQHPAGQANVPS